MADKTRREETAAATTRTAIIGGVGVVGRRTGGQQRKLADYYETRKFHNNRGLKSTRVSNRNYSIRKITPEKSISSTYAPNVSVARHQKAEEGCSCTGSRAREINITRDGGAAWRPATKVPYLVVGHVDGGASRGHAMAQRVRGVGKARRGPDLQQAQALVQPRSLRGCVPRARVARELPQTGAIPG